MAEARIFISYRRDDVAGDAGRLADHVQRRFGAGRVFLDIDTIEPGTDFVHVLQTSVQQTAAMLVVIGPRWTSLRNVDGMRRLDDPNDFVRREVEAALGRDIPVVPVLVQGAALPRAEDVPASLAPLTTRQAVTLDHAEFHDDAERLCDRLALVIDRGSTRWPRVRRWWPAAAAAALLAVVVAGYRVARTQGDERTAAITATEPEPSLPGVDRTAGTTAAEREPASAAGGDRPGAAKPKPLEQAGRIDALLAEASIQRRRNQTVEALATLARARELAPASDAVRRAQVDLAMEWIRNVRVESGKTSFGEAIKPALAVIDASLPSATGAHRADLLAHSGWASFLMWRDGNRRIDPTEWYREALSLDPGNPYANAMLAHWVLLQNDDVSRAVKLFDTALRAGRGKDAIRVLQWGGYGNASTPEADVERVRVADAMRREGERLSMEQASALWGPYYFALGRDKDRQVLLDALPPDDHITTLGWAFEEYAASDASRPRMMRFYVALLHARAGRTSQAVDDLRKLEAESAKAPGSLRDSVQAALKQLQPGTGRRPR